MSTHGSGSVVRQVSSAVVLALAIIASPALAQSADRPAVKVGDEWQFAEYYIGAAAAETESRLGGHLRHACRNRGHRERGAADADPGPEHRRVAADDNSDRRLLSFPLEVGKKWTFSNEFVQKDVDYKGRADISVTVVGREKVRVAAGEFDAFKLEAKGKSGVDGASGAGSIDVVRTYWYAPAARTIVKQETRNPTRGSETIELVSYKLQP